MPRARQISPIAAISWITPISLFTAITETRIVSGRSAALNASRSMQPVRQHVEVGRLEALALELAHRVERRLVLGLHGDDVLALVLVEVRRALQREVDRLGRARRPDDLLRVAVHQRRDLVARLLDRLLGVPAERVRARRGVAEVLGQVRDHLLRDARIDRRGRRIVEIDRHLHEGLVCAMLDTSAGDRRAGRAHGRRRRRLAVILQHRRHRLSAAAGARGRPASPTAG